MLPDKETAMTTQSAMNSTISEPTEQAGAQREGTGCCGGAAPKGSNACCALDAQVKSAGGSGCGCASDKPAKKTSCC